MMTFKELELRWDDCRDGQILVDHTHPLKLYLNVNDNGNKELLIPTEKDESYKFEPTSAIGIRTDKNIDTYYLAIELLSSDLAKEFIYLCNDIIESSRCFTTESESRKAIFSTLKKWYILLASSKANILDESSIRGLIAELLFIRDLIDIGKQDYSVINAWKTHKDSSKDFIFDDYWYEIKSKETSKDYITISSLDQLEREIDGSLVVYSLSKKQSSVDLTVSLNKLVTCLKEKMSFQAEISFTKKLLSKGYNYHKEYDYYCYSLDKKQEFLVNETFPRISKNLLSTAIIRAKYDLLIKGIEGWIINEE